MRWHQVVARARQQLREMSLADLETLAKLFKLEETADLCQNTVKIRKARARILKRPFNEFTYWAGFSVLGQVQRK